MAGITGLGVALGPVTGGLLLEHFSWGSVFFATIPVAVAALALGAWLVAASRDPAAPRLDLPGFVLSIAGSAYFGPVLVSMVLMAVGLGLVTAPSTGAILAVLPLGTPASRRDRRERD